MTFNASSHGLTGRDPVVASHAMLSSGHPLATEAGLQVLRNGGNAFDAVVCAAAVIAVVEPSTNHVGGDVFAIGEPGCFESPCEFLLAGDQRDLIDKCLGSRPAVEGEGLIRVDGGIPAIQGNRHWFDQESVRTHQLHREQRLVLRWVDDQGDFEVVFAIAEIVVSGNKLLILRSRPIRVDLAGDKAHIQRRQALHGISR